jgi:hypothetical protein
VLPFSFLAERVVSEPFLIISTSDLFHLLVFISLSKVCFNLIVLLISLIVSLSVKMFHNLSTFHIRFHSLLKIVISQVRLFFLKIASSALILSVI